MHQPAKRTVWTLVLIAAAIGVGAVALRFAVTASEEEREVDLFGEAIVGEAAALVEDADETTEHPTGRFGPGSVDALEGGSAPDGFPIKGNADSMLFHAPESPYYDRTVAEVWFATPEDAEAAGFTPWRPKHAKD